MPMTVITSPLTTTQEWESTSSLLPGNESTASAMRERDTAGG